MKNIGFEGATFILLLLYFVIFQLPKLIAIFMTTSKNDPFNDDDISGNDNIKPRKPQDFL
jgi:hypothetical protein